MENQYLVIGTIIQTDENKKIVVRERVGIVLEEGKIIEIDDEPKLSKVLPNHVIRTNPDFFFIPGFIDCHIHAPQFPNLGIGYDKGLLEWLETYTFPLEKKYSNEDYAEQVYDTVVQRTLKNGTTTACYYASLYGNSSVILGQRASSHGQQAFIGKVNMDVERTDGYFETTKISLDNTRKFIEDIRNLKDDRVNPVITPRFALSCSMKLMKGLGKMAREYDLNIQSHIAETPSEIDACKKLFPNCPTYASVYDEAELLTNKTLLAHGVYLEDNELQLLKDRGTSIIHCPSSNTYLKSGLCDIQRLRAHDINVGLGTDVSGGQNASILDTMKSAIEVSNHLEITKKDPSYKSINYLDAFHMATRGGAKALGIDSHAGSLEPGKFFDALLIKMSTNEGALDNLRDYTWEEQFERLIHSGDDRNIIQIFSGGHRIC